MVSLNKLVAAVAIASLTTGCSEKVEFASGLTSNKIARLECGDNGTPCEPSVDTINQQYLVPSGSGKVDVMFVLDTTPTMYLTITKLPKKFKALTSMLPDYVDWQVGISNASLNAYDGYKFKTGELLDLAMFPSMEVQGPPSILTKDTPSGDDIFMGNTSFLMQSWPGQQFCDAQPYCSLGEAEPMRDIKTAIEKRSNLNNSTFFRPGAMFVPIIISARDENAGAPKVSVTDVVNSFNQNLGSKMAGMKAFSIIIKPNDASCLDRFSSVFKEGSGGMYGTQLDQFAKQTGGESISICEDDYSQTLAKVVAGLTPQVTTLTLDQTPIAGSVKIASVPAADLQFTVSGKTVTFSSALKAGSKLSISYQVAVQ